MGETIDLTMKLTNTNTKTTWKKNENDELERDDEGIEKNRKGDIGEVIAKVWFMSNGWEVFGNEGCTGPIDMIAVDIQTGQTIFIDCKTHPNGVLTQDQIEIGVQVLWVNVKTGQCSFYKNDIWDKRQFDNIRNDIRNSVKQIWIDHYWNEKISDKLKNVKNMNRLKEISIKITKQTATIYEEVKTNELNRKRRIMKYLERQKAKNPLKKRSLGLIHKRDKK